MTSAERLRQYEEIFNRSQQYDPSRFQSDFEKAYGEATNYNKDLIEQRSGAIGQAQALPAQLRQQYSQSAIRNPLAQEALIATQRGNVTSDISRLTDLLGARGARYEDVLGKHLSAYQTDAQRAQRDAENAWRLYQDVLAQEEAERARAQAAADAAALRDLIATQYAPPPGPVEEEDDLVIDTGGNNWTNQYDGLGQKTNVLNAVPMAVGNYIGNKGRQNPQTGREMTFWERLQDRFMPIFGGGRGSSW